MNKNKLSLFLKQSCSCMACALIFFAMISILIILLMNCAGLARATTAKDQTGGKAEESGDQTQMTSMTGETPVLEEVTADDSDRTIAVPWTYPEIAGSLFEPPVPTHDDPACIPLDEKVLSQRLKKSEYLGVQYDRDANMLVTISPSDSLTVKARQAVNKSPTWMQKELEESFSRLAAATQDSYADLIINANDPYVDEIAWSVAHISTNDLTNSNFWKQLITDNANLLYKVDADVDYAEIVNYGNSIDGGDYYSTVKYKVDENGTINEYEYPRDIYYWYIVHPRGSDELPTYLDPDAPCSSSGTPSAPPNGRFWREYFYGCDSNSDGTIESACPTNYGQCDNDHDGTKDGPCPVMRDWLKEVHVLWAGKKDTHGPTNGAVGQVGEWVHRILGRWGDKDGCRPVEPMTIYYYQDGNCGEYQDMQTAAGRTALIPTIGVSAQANDHVWNEFYDRRWIEWQAEDIQIDHPEGHDGWAGGLAAVHAWRGDGYGWTDQTANYTPTCKLVVTIKDKNGYPVDGARIKVGSEPYNILCSYHIIVSQISGGHTDENGQITFTLGDNNSYPSICREYYVNVHTEWGDYPASGYTLVINNPAPNTTYYWTYQFTSQGVPRLSVSPASQTPDPSIDRFMEVHYSLTDEYLTGDAAYTSITYRQDIAPGNADFFISDSSNYSLFASGQPFQAYESAIDSKSGSPSFVPPVSDDWYAVWSNKASMNLQQVLDARVRLCQNNGLIPPVCNLHIGKGSTNEAILDWEDISCVNVDAYNVYRSLNASDVANGKTKEELAPFFLTTVEESTYSDVSEPSPGQVFYYTVRTLGKNGDIADEGACGF